MPKAEYRHQQTPADAADGTPRTPRRQRSEQASEPRAREIGGAPGPEATRYGDWQHKGRCSDF